MAEDKILAEARARIDAIDDQLLDLLNQRAALAHQVVIGKQAEADGEVIYYRPEREAEVMRRLLAANRGPFSNQTIQAVFREVISATLALEHPLAVAVSGQLGGVGEHAAACHFGRSVEVQNYSSLAAALDSVGRQSELALLAIDDARGSLFPEQLALLCESDLLPVAELVVMGKYGVVQCGNPAPDQAIEVKAPVDDEKGSPPLSVQSVPSAEFQQLLSHAEGDHRVMVNLDRDLVGWRGDCRYSEISMPVKTRFLVLGRQRCVSTGQD
ncbi:MAG: chorismate mutase, partial [Gammaproteobacteria bacterium]